MDDRFHSHPKAAAASLAALGLWALAGSWAKDHLTDGNIPEHMIPLLSRGATELADELVTVGLWRRTKAGYRFHQWRERNETRAEVNAKRAKVSAGGALGNHRRWHTKEGHQPDPNCIYCTPEQPKPPGRPHRPPDRGADNGANPPVQTNTTPRTATTPGSYGAQGRLARAPAREAPPTDAEPSRVEQLITQYRELSPRGLASNLAERLSVEIHQLVRDGFTNAEILHGLVQLRARKLGPTMLPAIVDELANTLPGTPGTPGNVVALRTEPRPSTGAQRAGAGIEIANRLRRQREETEHDTG